MDLTRMNANVHTMDEVRKALMLIKQTADEIVTQSEIPLDLLCRLDEVDSGGGAVTSVTAADATLTISPTTGAVLAARTAITGDVAIAGGSNASVLATVNGNVGSFGSATQVAAITVNAKGLVTAAANTAIAVPSSAITDFNAAVIALLTDANIPNTITLDNITQITTRSHTSLSEIGTNTHAQIDTHIAASNPHSGSQPLDATLTALAALDATAGILTQTGADAFARGQLSGDITTTGSSLAATIGAAKVTSAMLRNSAAVSVIGRSANSTGVPADIAAASDGHVLRRASGVLGFGGLDLTDTVTFAGPLPVELGGTFATTFTDGGVLIGNGLNQIQVTSAGTAGQVLTSNGAGVDPTFQAAAGGTTLPVADTQTIVKGSVDATKLLRFEVDGFTTATTRVLTPQDTDGTIALLGNKLSAFAATTSAELAGVISDETGSGALVFATSPTLVTPVLGTPASGDLSNCTGATLTAKGVVELATTAEINTGTDTTRAMPVDQYVASNRNVRYILARIVGETTNTAIANIVGGDVECPITGTITEVGAYVDTAGTTNLTTIDINKNGTTILSTKITLDSTEKSSRTAATPPVISVTSIAAGDLFTFDIDGISTTAAKGLTIRIGIRLT